MLAYHFDLKRAMWTRSYLDRMVRRLARWGFTDIVYEFEDKLRFDSHRDLAHRVAWSPAQTSAFVAATRARGLDVIPLIQTLGHAESVVGKPAYAHLRETPEVTDQYDPLSAEVQTFLTGLLDELIAIFQPRQFLHLGGDETWHLGKSEKCRDLVARIGVGSLYLQHMLPLFEHVRRRGLRPIIWADIVLTHPEVLAQMPRDVVLMDWRYDRTAERSPAVTIWGQPRCTWEEFAQLPESPAKALAAKYAVDAQSATDHQFRVFYHLEALRDAGFTVFTASANRCWGDSVGIPALMHGANVFLSARKGTSVGNGELVTSWAVRHNHPELTMLPTYAARLAQDPEAVYDPVTVATAYSKEVFGVALPELAQVHELAAPVVPFSEGWALERAMAQLNADQDPVGQLIREIEEGKRPALFPHLTLPAELTTREARREYALMQVVRNQEGYVRAGELLDELESRVKRNADVLMYWGEGVAVTTFYASFAMIALAGELPQYARRLLDQLGGLREVTRCLWRKSYVLRSADEELELRYGFHERYLQNCLRRAAATVAAPLNPSGRPVRTGRRTREK